MTRPVVVFTATEPHPCPMPDSGKLPIGSLAQCNECHQVCQLERDRTWRRDHNPGAPIVTTSIIGGITALQRVREDAPYAYVDERGNYVDAEGNPAPSPALTMLDNLREPGMPERREGRYDAKQVAFWLILLVCGVAFITAGVLAVSGYFG